MSPRQRARDPPAASRLDAWSATAGVGSSELGEVAGRLFEVVAEELVQLDEIMTVSREPVGEALMQVGADSLGKGVVGGVADQLMPEAVGGLVRDLGGPGG